MGDRVESFVVMTRSNKCVTSLMSEKIDMLSEISIVRRESRNYCECRSE